MSVGQVLLLAVVVPLYARLVALLPRRKLINTVTVFFAGCLVVFFGLAQLELHLGIVFFLWIGIFNLMIVAAVLVLRQRRLYPLGRGKVVPHCRLRRFVGGRARSENRGTPHPTSRNLPIDARRRVRLDTVTRHHELCGQKGARPPHDIGPIPRMESTDENPPSGRTKLRPQGAGVPTRLSNPLFAAHCLDADAPQLGEHHRRVHSGERGRRHGTRSGGNGAGGRGLTIEEYIGESMRISFES